MRKTEVVVDDSQVQCTRCRNKHMESERELVDVGNGNWAKVCPRCNCRSFLDIRPQAAWCWSSGLIEVGDEKDAPEGAILIARGPKAALLGVIDVLARHGRAASEGKYLVPGVPEADSEQAKSDALATWLNWCARGNGRKGRHEVFFATPNY